VGDEVFHLLPPRGLDQSIMVAVLATALGGGYVYAHAKDGDGSGYGKRGHCVHGERGHRGHGWGGHGAKADKHIEGILAFIETELKLDAVMPVGRPCLSCAVTTVTPVAKFDKASRNSRAENASGICAV